jgi:hypothetical protein
VGRTNLTETRTSSISRATIAKHNLVKNEASPLKISSEKHFFEENRIVFEHSDEQPAPRAA